MPSDFKYPNLSDKACAYFDDRAHVMHLSPGQLVYVVFAEMGLPSLLSKFSNQYAHYHRNSGKFDNHTGLIPEYIWLWLIVLFEMALSPKANTRMHWRLTPRGNQLIRNITGRDAWLDILMELTTYSIYQVTTKMMNDEPDRGYKISPLLDAFNDFFHDIFHIGENLSADEWLMPSRGVTGLLRVIKSKIHPVGIKFFKLCNKFGYCYYMFLDCNKNHNEMDKKYGAKSRVGYKVVRLLVDKMNLTQVAKKWPVNIFMNNWYGSIKLAQDLKAKNINICATAKKNAARMPKNLVTNTNGTKLSKGSHKILHDQKSGITILGIHDRKIFRMISTLPINYSKTIEVSKHGSTKIVSIINHQYNKNMGGVDLHDQKTITISVQLKSRKWTKKGLYGVIDSMLAQCHIIYNCTTGCKYPMTKNKNATQEQMNALNSKRRPLSKAEFIEEACNQLIPYIFLRIRKLWKTHHLKHQTYDELPDSQKRWVDQHNYHWKHFRPLTKPEKFKLTRANKWPHHYDKFHKDWDPR